MPAPGVERLDLAGRLRPAGGESTPQRRPGIADQQHASRRPAVGQHGHPVIGLQRETAAQHQAVFRQRGGNGLQNRHAGGL
jgi:hypothetical protein